jgi:Asp-tRNA(Asn)/Glu-tRNA(Gln) amidotransferase A subunit family amidase
VETGANSRIIRMPLVEPSPIQTFRAARLKAGFDPVEHLHSTLARANGNLSRNTYIALDPAWSAREAQRQAERYSSESEKPDALPPLWGLPVSLKDCFDLEGFKTSSGSKFYEAHRSIASSDSAVAARLKEAGAVITGKTHLQQLAYGITGENRDYGNCLQPADGNRLTGGSSSGAAASIQEGSALAAIGTDTGGSIRLPAAICGLAGYRASYGVAEWKGGDHLAHSFDTVGWLFRDLRDAPLLAEAIFRLPQSRAQEKDDIIASADVMKIGVLTGPLAEDCDHAVQCASAVWHERLRSVGAQLQPFEPEFWLEAWDIYVTIQAYEAAKVHAGFYHEFEPAIASRLEWGAAIGEDEMRLMHHRLRVFRDKMESLFCQFDLLLAPTTPVSILDAARDQSEERAHILRLTTPGSLAGMPAVVLPSPDCGLQLLAAHNDDRRLLRFAACLGRRLAEETASR